MTNFKNVEVKAFSKTEAMEKAPFDIINDATQAWKNAGSPLTGNDLKEFMAAQLQKKTKFAEGIGCILTIDPGTPDTRNRPYLIENVKNEQGKRSFKKAFLIIDKDTNTILGEVFGNQTDAEAELKSLYVNGYKGTAIVRIIHDVVEGEPIAFTGKYVASKNAHEGTYFAFGVEKF